MPVVAFSLLVLPWVNPFAPGPSPALMPWLFSWGCLAALAGMWGVHHQRPSARSWAPVIAWAWLLAGALSSVIGLCQYFGVAAYFSPWMILPSMGEAFANLRQRNQFASLTNLSLVAGVWFVATGSLCSTSKGRYRGF